MFMKRLISLLMIMVVCLTMVAVGVVNTGAAAKYVNIQDIRYGTTKGFTDSVRLTFSSYNNARAYRLYYKIMDGNRLVKNWTKYKDWVPRVYAKSYTAEVLIPCKELANLKANGGNYGIVDSRGCTLGNQTIKFYFTVRALNRVGGSPIDSYYIPGCYVYMPMYDIAPQIYGYSWDNNYSCGVWVYKEMSDMGIRGYYLYVKNKKGNWERISSTSNVNIEDERAPINSRMVKAGRFWNISSNQINKAKRYSNSNGTYILMTARGYNSKGSFCTPFAPVLVYIKNGHLKSDW